MRRTLPLARYYIAKGDRNKIVHVITKDSSKVVYHAVEQQQLPNEKFEKDFVLYSDEGEKKEKYNPDVEMSKVKIESIRTFASTVLFVGVWLVLMGRI